VWAHVGMWAPERAQGYRWADMPAFRVLALWLAAALCVSCSKSDASSQEVHSTPSASGAGASAGESAGDAPDLATRSFPLLIWSAHTVDKEYFDKSRIAPRDQLVYATKVLGLQIPEFFARVDQQREVVHIEVRAATEAFSLADVDSLGAAADRLEEILEFTQRILDLETERLHEIEYVAINGLFAPLDPHTILLTPEEHADLGIRTKGEFGGIGAQIRAESRRIVIIKVLPGMPAELAGVQAGDVVLEIDGVRTVNMTASEAQGLLRGPVNTSVAVKLRRAKKTLTFEIERDVIKIDSVILEMLPGQIAYVHIANFQENTAEQVEELLTAQGIAKGEVQGVVFDLRGNSGGLLTQATGIVDQLVGRGDLVIVRSAMGREVDAAKEETLVPEEASIVVLIDEQSASASEIVSGGVKALGRGVVLGRSSFGKGTVQMIRPAAPYGRPLALKLTVAEYLVAGDARIQTRGVTPDLQLHPVELSSIPGIVRYFDLERFERERERSRTANLPSALHDHGELARELSHADLHYLWNDSVPESVLEAFELEVGDLPAPMRDPEVRIAQQVAVALRGAPSRSARVEALKTAALEIAAQEDIRIVDALAKMKVDWSPSPEPDRSAPSIAVTATLASSEPVAAGEPFALRVEVVNEGPTPVHRVHVITDCVHDELDGIEMMLGSIEPGKSAVREVSLHVMPWHSDFTDRIRLDAFVGEPTDAPHAQTSVMFEVVGAARPALGYDVWLVDDPDLAGKSPKRPESEPIPGEPPFVVQGNGDGVLQPGERVLLVFAARNDGPGKSPDVRAVVRNMSGKQGLLEEGLVPIGALAPGDVRTGAFGITIADDADPSLPFEVELTVGDAVLRTSARNRLRFRVHAVAETFEPGEASFRVADEPVRAYAGAHGSSSVVAEIPVGAQVHTLGTIGAWKVLAADTPGRRLFVPGDLSALQPMHAPAGEAQGLAVRPAVLPPTISVDPHPQVTSANAIELRGVVAHPERVRDVVVLVRPPGPAQIDHKVAYAAGKAGGEPLSFRAEVPLEPGGNRVIIVARDGAKVEQRRDLWVYRTPG
jgi:carboxyl-terminal processing protease